ncbi:hypothetical protein CC80DRAFT_30286 [Byssothecium circinans]|uniref:Uncharacterized protein n=1 Tax=Byssothecium circinans TaxID=147558 RepID=A0A6A5U0G6_9PLEO|nr:hypothetical protein CC80DRAFT_30286 [Byssothecium circinans]
MRASRSEITLESISNCASVHDRCREGCPRRSGALAHDPVVGLVGCGALAIYPFTQPSLIRHIDVWINRQRSCRPRMMPVSNLPRSQKRSSAQPHVNTCFH